MNNRNMIVENVVLTGTIKDIVYDESRKLNYVFIQIDNEENDSDIDFYTNLFFPDSDGLVKLTLCYGDYDVTNGLFEYPDYISVTKVIGRYVEFNMIMEYDSDSTFQYLANLDVYSSKEKYLDGNDMSD